MEFHHLGYACCDIEKELMHMIPLGYTQESQIFIDSLQGIRGVFITGNGPRIELLENLPGAARLNGLIKSGTRIYHMGYLCDDFEAEFSEIRLQHAKVISPPMISTYFGGRICFVVLRSGFIVELIEKCNDGIQTA